MTPKEKAQYLVDKFIPYAYGIWDKNGSKEERYYSKQCALIAVNEIIEVAYWNSVKEYYQEVKQEIEKL